MVLVDGQASSAGRTDWAKMGVCLLWEVFIAYMYVEVSNILVVLFPT
jgi:hypothetical protein